MVAFYKKKLRASENIKGKEDSNDNNRKKIGGEKGSVDLFVKTLDFYTVFPVKVM